MKRRTFIAGLGTAAALAYGLAAWAQQQNDRLRTMQFHTLRLQAEGLADKIASFFQALEGQLGSTTQLSWSVTGLEQRRFDGLRLLRQTPAISELLQLDGAGVEKLRLSRNAMDVAGAQTDYAKDPKFTVAMAKKVYHGPVYFRGTSDAYVIISIAGPRQEAGVIIAEVSLKLIQDMVWETQVGDHGVAYVVDAGNRVIAHPDLDLLQRDFSELSQVVAARGNPATDPARMARDIHGQDVLTTYSAVAPLGWLVFTELPATEMATPTR